ncbi:MAG: hypothetical protein LBU20_01790, partial [Candidatus Nomurabacteria bacterium]|jgi:Na+-driven multidrug efflux pump|nr:hypothetical protein [Candidatus Nomurabacteria bacterium]
MLISMISQFAVQIPLAWQLSARIGIDGIWWSFVASFAISLILTWGFYLQGSWARKRLTEDDKLEAEASEDVEDRL